MFRLLLIAVCLVISVHAYSDGAPKGACPDLTPQHGAQPQSRKAPYSLSGPAHVSSGGKVSLTLSGETFVGFMIQARDGQNRVIGQFQVVDNDHSQTLDCSGKDDTLTHRKIHKSPITKLSFDWIAPAGYHGNVKFMATVVESSFVYWVGRVTKDIDVEKP